MHRPLALAVLALVATACADAPTSTLPLLPHASRSATATIDPALSEALASADATTQLEVIVTFDRATATSDAVADVVLATGAGIVQFKHLPMVAALATPAQIAAVAESPSVEGVWLNRRLYYLMKESRATIRADQVHSELGIDGRGVGVAILDSGIDGLYNQDLAYPSKTVQNAKWAVESRDAYYTATDAYGDGQVPEGWVRVGDTKLAKWPAAIRKGHALYLEDVANSETSVGHGTHVAGTVAGTGGHSGGDYKGVAPGADLIGLGAGDILFIFWILAGFDYILEHQDEYNIQVVNNSWGSSGEFNAKDPINKATKEVYDAGITVVFAAGNCGDGTLFWGLQDPTCAPVGQTQLNPYSVAPWVIGVAAGCKIGPDPTDSRSLCDDVDTNGDGAADRDSTLAYFSSRGLPGRGELYEPDVTAPGVNIVSSRASMGTVMNVLDTFSDFFICNATVEHQAYYTCASGTSMASPHVAGVVALMEQASGGTLTPDQALAVLKATARPMPGYHPHEVGAGYVDAFAAVSAVKR